MEIINQYFGKIVFVKVDKREDHSIYVAALSSSFQDGKKQYALAFVPVHLAIVNQGYLSDLSWVNLQTRTMTNGYRIKPQRWEIPKGLNNPMFTAVERTEQKTKYLSDAFHLEMVLIHDPKKKSKLQYHSHMNLLAALTTFKCVISLTEQQVQPSVQQAPPLGVYRQPLQSNQPFNPAVGPPPPGHFPQEESRLSPMTYEYVLPKERAVDGKYNTIGLSEYTIPQITGGPQKSAGASARQTSPFGAKPAQSAMTYPTQGGGAEHIDDSYELL